MYIESYKYQLNRYRVITSTNLIAMELSHHSSISSSVTNTNNKLIQTKPSYWEFRRKFKLTKISNRTKTSNHIDDGARTNQNTSKVTITRYSDNMIENEFGEDYDQENNSYPISSAQKEYLAASFVPQPTRHGKSFLDKFRNNWLINATTVNTVCP